MTSFRRRGSRIATFCNALTCVPRGERFRDRVAIFINLAMVVTYPVGIVFRRLGHPLPYPMRVPYRVRSPFGTIVAPGGLHFLQASPRYDSPVKRLIGDLTAGTFLDVGASVGIFSLQAARRLGAAGRVLAFEPAFDRFACLEANVLLNGLGNVTPVCCAIGANEGEGTLVALTCGPNPCDISVRVVPSARARSAKRRVPLHRLDDQVDPLEPVALVKIDVEGGELDVLRGMTAILERCHPVVVFEALSAAKAQACSDLLRAFGYAVSGSVPGDLVARPACHQTGAERGLAWVR